MDKKKVVKKLNGTVVSLSGANTIKVRVETKKPHPLYGKVMKSHKNYLVDTANYEDELTVGDQVMIKETKPLSKTKKFVLVNKVK